MSKCEHYYTTECGGYILSPAAGKPIPQICVHGACSRANKRCECDGEQSRCDYYSEVKKGASAKGCATCKHLGCDEVCRLRNCHRIFTKAELENKDFVSDAWEEND